MTLHDDASLPRQSANVASKSGAKQPAHFSSRYTTAWYLTVILLYLGITTPNLGLPGLHYDEAKEAGLNAMEILLGQPVTAFREASIKVVGVDLPLMVQDYIGALNVYLCIPILKLTGIGVPNLRFLSVLLGLATLLTLERAISNWQALLSQWKEQRVPISPAGLITITLLAASPSFVFWGRQGIFVTNVIQPLTIGFMWMGLVWLRTQRLGSLWLAGGLAGLALYGKLIAIWIIAPFILYLLIASWLSGRRRAQSTPAFLAQWASFGAVLLVPLLPFLLFNAQTQGTFAAILTNAGESYYGVNNLAIFANSGRRWSQLLDVLRGNHFWYLGGIHGNPLAPWLALAALLLGLLFRPKSILPWLLLIGSAFLLSLFTISDLFITHFALLHPLIMGAVGVGLAALLEPWLLSSPAVEQPGATAENRPFGDNIIFGHKSRVLRVVITGVLAAVWLLGDISASVGYHQSLVRSGGLADHSDASYTLAYHLRYNGMGAPILLDWGMDAPIRYLTEGTVRPIEIFGYASPQVADDDFPNRLNQFLDNPDNVYLLHSPGTTVFAGRREQFFAEVDSRSLSANLEETFAQRDGTPLFELWRVQ